MPLQGIAQAMCTPPCALGKSPRQDVLLAIPTEGAQVLTQSIVSRASTEASLLVLLSPRLGLAWIGVILGVQLTAVLSPGPMGIARSIELVPSIL